MALLDSLLTTPLATAEPVQLVDVLLVFIDIEVLPYFAALIAVLLYALSREKATHAVYAVVGGVMAHVLFVLLAMYIPRLIGFEKDTLDLIEFEVAELAEPEPPKQEEPEPEEEPEQEEPEPEPEPEIKKEEPPPKPKPKQAPEPQPEPNPEPAPPKRWDLSNTTQGGNSGVVVEQGSGGEYGGQGKRDSKGTKKGPVGGDPKGDPEGTGAKWEPRSELFIKELPKPVKVPKIECPATAELGVQGEVVLKIQIQRDGTVRKVTVVKGIGQGCDEVAVKALKKARFKAAVGTNGQSVDYELTRYIYEFTIKD